MNSGNPLEAAVQKLKASNIELPQVPVHLGSYGDSPELERGLIGLIRSGTKTATASLSWSYRAEKIELPAAGDIEIVVNSLGQPEVVTQIISVMVVPFSEVTSEHAAKEGEGDKSLKYWQETHWQFFSQECERIGRVPSAQMPVVCTTFKVLHIIDATTAA